MDFIQLFKDLPTEIVFIIYLIYNQHQNKLDTKKIIDDNKLEQKELFKEYRKRLEDCNETFKDDLKDLKNDVHKIAEHHKIK